jgi:hypothetical protein
MKITPKSGGAGRYDNLAPTDDWGERPVVPVTAFPDFPEIVTRKAPDPLQAGGTYR